MLAADERAALIDEAWSALGFFPANADDKDVASWAWLVVLAGKEPMLASDRSDEI